MEDIEKLKETAESKKEKSVSNQLLNEEDLELVSGGTDIDDTKNNDKSSGSVNSDGGKKHKNQFESNLKTAKDYLDKTNKLLDYLGF